MDRSKPFAEMDEYLKRLAASLPAPPSWCDALTKLCPTSTEEDRLAVYQEVRRSGLVPDAASFYLVSFLIDEITARDAEQTLGEREKRLEEIEQKYGLDEGGLWPAGTAPDGYDVLRAEYQRAWDRLFAQKLESLGGTEMARLFREDLEQFETLSELGRRLVFPEKDNMDETTLEAWVRELVQAVADCMSPEEPMGALGYRYCDHEEPTVVQIYTTPVEWIGGAEDGEQEYPSFVLDLDQLQLAFDRVQSLAWCSLWHDDEAGPRVTLLGLFKGREVELDVLALTPEDEPPGMKIGTLSPRG